MESDQDTCRYVQYGDVISLYFPCCGYLCVPPQQEPFPEENDCVSHIRVAYAESSCVTPSDFCIRCLLLISPVKNSLVKGPVLFGSLFTLQVVTWNYFVTASTDDNIISSSKLKCMYLTNVLNEKLATKWIFCPKFVLNSIGDPVQYGDFAILRSSSMSNFAVSYEHLSHSVGLRDLPPEAVYNCNVNNKYADFLQVLKCKSVPDVDTMTDTMLFFGDFVTIRHHQIGGLFLCRMDDNALRIGEVSPLGELFRSKCTPCDYGVYVRKITNTMPHTKEESDAAPSVSMNDTSDCSASLAQSVFQIVPHLNSSIDYSKPVTCCAKFCFRHVLSGKYLRWQVDPSDTDTDNAIYGDVGASTAHIASSIISSCVSASFTCDIFSTFSLEPVYSHCHSQGMKSPIVMGEKYYVSFSYQHSKFLLNCDGMRSSGDCDSCWFEYKDDYAADGAVVNQHNIYSNCVSLKKIDVSFARDVLFVSKYDNLAKTAVTCYQLSKSIDYLHSPVFLHFQLSLSAICHWLCGYDENYASLPNVSRCLCTDVSGTLSDLTEVSNVSSSCTSSSSSVVSFEEFSASRKRLSTMYFPSATPVVESPRKASGTPASTNNDNRSSVFTSLIVPWLGLSKDVFFSGILNQLKCCRRHYGRNMPRDIALFGSSLLSSNAAVSSVTRQRQHILMSSGIIECILFFCVMLYNSHKMMIAPLIQSNQISLESKNTDSIVHCCHLMYDLLEHCLFSNVELSIRLVSIRGCLSSMISQSLQGWKPPIERIMNNTLNYNMRSASFSLCKLDFEEVLKRSMLLQQSNPPTALHLLDLLICFSDRLSEFNHDCLNLREHITNVILPISVSHSAAQEHFSRDCSLFSLLREDKIWKVQLATIERYVGQSPIDKASLTFIEVKLKKFIHWLQKRIVDNSISVNLMLEDMGFGNQTLFDNVCILATYSAISDISKWWIKWQYPCLCRSSVVWSLVEDVVRMHKGRIDLEIHSCKEEMLVLRLRKWTSLDIQLIPFVFEPSCRCVATGMFPHSAPSGITDVINDISMLNSWESLVTLTQEQESLSYQWLTKCLTLFVVLCAGQDWLVQFKISYILPAGFLVDCLRSGQLDSRLNALMCDCLTAVYFKHDLVFPSVILTSADSLFCGLEESPKSNELQRFGLVFNDCIGPGNFGDTQLLRVELVEYIIEELKKMDLQARSCSSFLSMLCMMMSKGFFHNENWSEKIGFDWEDIGEILIDSLKVSTRDQYPQVPLKRSSEVPSEPLLAVIESVRTIALMFDIIQMSSLQRTARETYQFLTMHNRHQESRKTKGCANWFRRNYLACVQEIFPPSANFSSALVDLMLYRNASVNSMVLQLLTQHSSVDSCLLMALSKVTFVPTTHESNILRILSFFREILHRTVSVLPKEVSLERKQFCCTLISDVLNNMRRVFGCFDISSCSAIPESDHFLAAQRDSFLESTLVPNIDVVLFGTALCSEMISMIKSIFSEKVINTCHYSWIALSTEEKSVVDAMFAYVVDISAFSKTLAEEWFASCLDIVVDCFSECIGAARLLCLMSRYCRVQETCCFMNSNFSRVIKEVQSSHGYLPWWVLTVISSLSQNGYILPGELIEVIKEEHLRIDDTVPQFLSDVCFGPSSPSMAMYDMRYRISLTQLHLALVKGYVWQVFSISEYYSTKRCEEILKHPGLPLVFKVMFLEIWFDVAEMPEKAKRFGLVIGKSIIQLANELLQRQLVAGEKCGSLHNAIFYFFTTGIVSTCRNITNFSPGLSNPEVLNRYIQFVTDVENARFSGSSLSTLSCAHSSFPRSKSIAQRFFLLNAANQMLYVQGLVDFVENYDCARCCMDFVQIVQLLTAYVENNDFAIFKILWINSHNKTYVCDVDDLLGSVLLVFAAGSLIHFILNSQKNINEQLENSQMDLVLCRMIGLLHTLSDNYCQHGVHTTDGVMVFMKKVLISSHSPSHPVEKVVSWRFKTVPSEDSLSTARRVLLLSLLADSSSNDKEKILLSNICHFIGSESRPSSNYNLIFLQWLLLVLGNIGDSGSNEKTTSSIEPSRVSQYSNSNDIIVMLLRFLGRCCIDPIMVNSKSLQNLEVAAVSLKVLLLFLSSHYENVQNILMRLPLNVTRPFFTSMKIIMLHCEFVIENVLFSNVGFVDVDAAYVELVYYTLNHCFTVCRLLSAGYRRQPKDFLRTQITTSNEMQVNVIDVVVRIMRKLMRNCCNCMINYFVFHEEVSEYAPFVWVRMDDSIRQFIDWNTYTTDVLNHLQHHLSAINSGIIMLTECCKCDCQENQTLILPIFHFLPTLLEFVGVMHLKVETDITLYARLGYSKCSWHGGHPFLFYQQYLQIVRHKFRCNKLTPDMYESIVGNISLVRWKRFSLSRKPRGKLADYILGHRRSNVSLSEKRQRFDAVREVKAVAQLVELNIVNCVLCFLETPTNDSLQKLSNLFHFGILMQNMNSCFSLSVRNFGRHCLQDWQTLSVNYLILLQTLTYWKVVKSLHHRRFNCEQEVMLWKRSWCSSTEGSAYSVGASAGPFILSSVEILGKHSLQRIHFPVPYLIASFWHYPETQRAKHDILWSLNCSTTEEKLADFYDKIDVLPSVMKRQEKLKHLLTPVIHSFFGGKSDISLLNYIPGQRMLLLLVTVVLNIFYLYANYLKDESAAASSDRAVSFFDCAVSYTGCYEIKWYFQLLSRVHILLSFSVLIRNILNYPEQHGISTSRGNSSTSDLVLCFSVLYQILINSIWSFIILTLSVGGLFGVTWIYAFCLFDVIPQHRLALFLVEAIRRNVRKIGITLGMLLLLIYCSSLTSFILFNGDYGFNGHSCNSLLSCMKLHIDYGISEIPDWDGNSYIDPRLNVGNSAFSLSFWGIALAQTIGSLYNVTYLILVTLVFQAVISGLIIDTFGAMRSESENVEQNMKSSCFICSLSRDTFDRGSGFREHIQEDHNMWSYVWFKIYLESKDIQLLTGSEFYAYTQMQSKQGFANIIPVSRSLTLERRRENIAKKRVNEDMHI